MPTEIIDSPDFDKKLPRMDGLEGDLSSEMIESVVSHLAQIENDKTQHLHNAARMLLKNYLRYLSSLENHTNFELMDTLKTLLGLFGRHTNEMRMDIELAGEKHQALLKDDTDLIERLRIIIQDQKSKLSQVLPQTMDTRRSAVENSLLLPGTGRHIVLQSKPAEDNQEIFETTPPNRPKKPFAQSYKENGLLMISGRRENRLSSQKESRWPPKEAAASIGQLQQAVDSSNGLFTAADLTGMSRNMLNALVQPACLAAIQEDLFKIAAIKTLEFSSIYCLIKPQALAAIRNGVFTVAELAGMSHGAIYHLLMPACLAAIQEGLFKVADIKTIGGFGIAGLIRSESLQAIRDGLFAVADLVEMSDVAISELTCKKCLTALRDGRTSIDLLITMTAEELREANQTGNYPNPPGLTR